MPAVVLQSKWSDTHGVRYRLYIIDSEAGGGGVPEFDIVFGSVVITDEGDENDPFKRVIPKTASWTMLMNSSNYSVETKGAISTFYNNLTESYEGRYFVEISYNDTGTYKPLFRGKILPDVGDLVLNLHEDFKVTAICGLRDLFNIEYKSPFANGQFEDIPLSFIEHFSRILKLNQVCEFFDLWGPGTGATTIFTTSQHWVSNFHTVTEDIWAFVHRRNGYYEQVTPTFRRYRNAGEVLTDLLTGFNARIYQAKGVFNIEQLSYQDNALVARRHYNIEGVEFIAKTDNKKRWLMKDPNPIEILTHPVVKRLPPLKAVKLIQNKGYQNIWNGLTMSYPSDPGPKNLGPQIADGMTMALDFSFDIEPATPGTPGVRWLYADITVTMKIKIGNYYMVPVGPDGTPISIIERWPEFANGGVYPAQQFDWTLADTAFSLNIDVRYWILENILPWSFYFYTTEIPEEGDLIIEMTAIDGWVKANPGAAETPITEITINPRSRIHISEQGLDSFSTVPDQVTLVQVNNIKNTYVYETELSYYDYGGNVLRADGTTGVSKDILYAGPSQLYVTGDWYDPDDALTVLPIQELFMKSVLTMRSLPNKVVNMTMIHTNGVVLHSDDIFVWQPEIYLPIKSSHNLSTGEYSYSLWRLTKDFQPVTTEVDISISEPYVPPGIPLDAENPPVGYGIIHFEEWFDVTNNYVEPDYPINLINQDDIDFIKKNYFLVINGVKQRYSLSTPVNGTWRFDETLPRILFWKGSQPVKWIEFTTFF